MSITVYELCTTLERRRCFSPFAWRGVLAVAHKEFALERVPVNFFEKEQIAFSGQLLVPIIVDHGNGDKVVTDSYKIAEYLEATYPQRPSLFGGSKELSYFVVQWVNTIIHPFISKFCSDDARLHQSLEGQAYYYSEERSKLYGRKMQKSQVEDREALLPEFRAALQPARAVLRDQKFLGGDRPNYADICLFSSFLWSRAISSFYPNLLLPHDSVFAWRERMMDAYGGLARKSPGYDQVAPTL
ncbi:glutathione S-transferase domain-containing protein [Gonapodya prolifera JEL478]|uniref:Glutathione S-transferase domain-containing protein n=1 Tax=Gonapodya prolifera (strain JEL478) TaxID=1344416 RepID=A0A139ABB4_GONPJ|nr:glutathione S-transferase domain-containing protein [Gonapodya prolifera JEL478]|eukprot:KXS13755.1 glutathione S-transferase domain-containing protein [Gonapodya prolifera JEL478]